MTEEQQIVLSCVSASYRKAERERIRSLANRNLDWNNVVLESRWQGVLPLVYMELKGFHQEYLPPEALLIVGREFEKELKRGMFLSSILFSLIDRLEESAIQVVPFKGAVFADRYYGSVAHRSFWDIDLLLRKKDIVAAKDIMLSLGYQPEEAWSSLGEKLNLRFNCEYNFDLGENGTHVELHWDFVRKYIRCKLRGEAVLDNAEVSDLLGRPIHTLSREDRFMVICLHNGVKHHWHRLRMICDLAKLFEKDQDLDWRSLIHRCRDYGLYRAASVGTRLVEMLIGAPVPEDARQGIDRNAATERLAVEISSQTFLEREQPPHALRFHGMAIQLREKAADRMRYFPHILKETVFPSDKEEIIIPGNGPVVGALRTVIRPFRLVGKYLTMSRKEEST